MPSQHNPEEPGLAANREPAGFSCAFGPHLYETAQAGPYPRGGVSGTTFAASLYISRFADLFHHAFSRPDPGSDEHIHLSSVYGVGGCQLVDPRVYACGMEQVPEIKKEQHNQKQRTVIAQYAVYW